MYTQFYMIFCNNRISMCYKLNFTVKNNFIVRTAINKLLNITHITSTVIFYFLQEENTKNTVGKLLNIETK